MSDATQLAAEARCGVALSRALVEHVIRMRAAGYADEISLCGETWAVSISLKTPAS